MAIIQIGSDNPDFSYIIKKSPNNNFMAKELRKGILFGYYSKNDITEFNLYFKDSDAEVSYTTNKNEKFEYMNTTRYNSPIFIINSFSELLSSAIKKQDERDISEKYTNRIFINMVFIQKLSYIEQFKKYFSDFDFDIEHLIHKNYSISISTNKSLYELLNLVNLLALFLSMVSKEFLDINEGSIQKYIKALNIVDSPFYIRYLLGRTLLNSQKKFNMFKKDLELTNFYNQIDMKYGDTSRQRFDFVQKVLSFNKPILDIGCGDGFYAIPFSKKIKDFTYTAIDIDESVRKRLDLKIKKHEIDNISVLDNLNKYTSAEEIDILLIEVIEHMPLTDSTMLIKKVLRKNFDKLIISTPDKDFNEHYMLEGFRHLDHDWEMNKSEFKKYISNFNLEDFDVEFINIGDEIDGVSTSQGVIIKKKGNK